MAYVAGELVGLGIVVFIVVGVVRTLTRPNLTMKEKILGRSRRSKHDQR